MSRSDLQCERPRKAFVSSCRADMPSRWIWSTNAVVMNESSSMTSIGDRFCLSEINRSLTLRKPWNAWLFILCY